MLKSSIVTFSYIKEKSALKKLENVRKDHEKRLDQLQKEQVSLNKCTITCRPTNLYGQIYMPVYKKFSSKLM